MFSQLNVPHLQTEEAAYTYVEARLWPKGPVCPHCGATEEHVGKLQGKSSRVGLYKCYACRDPFTVKIGTIFEDSHLPLHLWLQAIYLICSSKKGISTRQVQRTLGVGLKTAWHLMHRIRHAMEDGKLGPLGGIGVVIEADETYVGGKEKNKHVGKRSAGNIGGTGKAIVFSLVERGGRVRSHVVPNVTGDTLREVLKVHANKRSALMTDDAGQYRHMGSLLPHYVVNHSADEYVRRLGNGILAHTNTAEGFFSILKRGINGCYFHVSEAHLHRYLAEFDFRYSNRERLGVDDVQRAEIALQGVKGKRLTYRTTRGGRPAQAPAN